MNCVSAFNQKVICTTQNHNLNRSFNLKIWKRTWHLDCFFMIVDSTRQDHIWISGTEYFNFLFLLKFTLSLQQLHTKKNSSTSNFSTFNHSLMITHLKLMINNRHNRIYILGSFYVSMFLCFYVPYGWPNSWTDCTQIVRAYSPWSELPIKLKKI